MIPRGLRRRRAPFSSRSRSRVVVWGRVWAGLAWGVWWLWYACLTSSLVLWLVFMAFLVLGVWGTLLGASTIPP